MKKPYKTPKLIAYGGIKEITEFSLKDAQEINKFIEGGVGLFASMMGL